MYFVNIQNSSPNPVGYPSFEDKKSAPKFPVNSGSLKLDDSSSSSSGGIPFFSSSSFFFRYISSSVTASLAHPC